MGYYTDYDLEVFSAEPNSRKNLYEETAIARVLYQIVNSCSPEDANEVQVFGDLCEFEDSCKWYDHENDMKELSRRFPAYRFALSGKGENHEDIWMKHFVNGKMQKCYAVFTIPSYDPSQLK